MSDEIVTVQEVAAPIKVADKTFYTIGQKAETLAFNVRGQWRSRLVGVDRWIQEQTAARRDNGDARE